MQNNVLIFCGVSQIFFKKFWSSASIFSKKLSQPPGTDSRRSDSSEPQKHPGIPRRQLTVAHVPRPSASPRQPSRTVSQPRRNRDLNQKKTSTNLCLLRQASARLDTAALCSFTALAETSVSATADVHLPTTRPAALQPIPVLTYRWPRFVTGPSVLYNHDKFNDQYPGSA